MAVLRDMSPELHKLTRGLNVHVVACFKINNSEYRTVLELATSCHSLRPRAASRGGVRVASDLSWSPSSCRGRASTTSVHPLRDLPTLQELPRHLLAHGV